MIRVELPAHLRTLAGLGYEVTVEIDGEVTQRAVIDALEARYPALGGTIRDYVTQERRPFLRFFACEQDLSPVLPEAPQPDAVARGAEPFLVIGALHDAGQRTDWVVGVLNGRCVRRRRGRADRAA